MLILKLGTWFRILNGLHRGGEGVFLNHCNYDSHNWLSEAEFSKLRLERLWASHQSFQNLVHQFWIWELRSLPQPDSWSGMGPVRDLIGSVLETVRHSVCDASPIKMICEGWNEPALLRVSFFFLCRRIPYPSFAYWGGQYLFFIVNHWLHEEIHMGLVQKCLDRGANDTRNTYAQ